MAYPTDDGTGDIPLPVSPPAPPLAAQYAGPPIGHDPVTGRPFISWGQQRFFDLNHLVDWMNSRGAATTLEHFLRRHPSIAAAFGQRMVAPAPHPMPIPTPPRLTARRARGRRRGR